MNNNLEDTGPGLERPIDPRASKGGFYTPPPEVKVGNYANHPAYKPSNDAHEANVRACMTPGDLTDLVVECHLAAWKAGWWHDPRTGLPLARNAGEMMLLQCSELGEAADGLDFDAMDDKLPHRKMIEVEIADFLIRLYDYCGGLRLDLQMAVMRSEARESFYTAVHPLPHATPALWQTTRHILKAMEEHRKNRLGSHVMCLARAHRMVNQYAETLSLDVEGARVEKMRFNAIRPDHQKAARLAAGGKAY